MFQRSKFRLVQARPSKKTYKDLSLPPPTGAANGITTNSTHAAVMIGNAAHGELAILPLDMSGSTQKSDLNLVRHGGQVQSAQFSRYNRGSTLATGAKDGSVKLWDLKEAGAPSTEASFSLDSGVGAVNTMQWHTTADSVLGVAAKSGLAVIDSSQGSVVSSGALAGFGNDALSLAWSYSGDSLQFVTKKSELHSWDVRQKADFASSGHKLSIRANSVLSMGNTGHLLVCGQTNFREPVVHIYDPRKPEEALLKHKLQLSTGTVLPIYDADSQLLFVSVRGSTKLNLYDLSEATSQNKFHLVDALTTQTSFQGFAAVPKFALDCGSNEIARIVKLSPNTIEPIGFNVPRKSRDFASDLFPDTIGPDAAQTAAEFVAGGNAQPKTISLSLDGTNTVSTASIQTESNTKRTAIKQHAYLQHAAGEQAVVAQEKAQTTQSSAVHQRLNSKSAKRRQFEAGMSNHNTFTHTTGHEPRSQSAFHSHCTPQANLAQCRNVVTNKHYAAVPWKTSGGSAVAVLPVGPETKFGRVAKDLPLVRGHNSQVTCVDLSQVSSAQDLLATAGNDGKVLIFRIPEGGLQRDLGLNEAARVLQNPGKVAQVLWNPCVAHVLAVVTVDIGQSSTVLVWNTETGEKKCEVDCHSAQVWDMCWDYEGDLLATTSKDGNTRVIDMRAGDVVHEWQTLESVRFTQVLWVDSEHLITIGFGKRAMRRFSLWNTADLSKPVAFKELGTSNSHMIPFFDFDTQLLYVANNGERTVHIFAILTASGEIRKLSGYQSQSLVSGMALRPKQCCDVAACEIGVGVKITLDTVTPISFTVPRKRKEFFQDDLFPPTRSLEPALTPQQWFDGQRVAVARDSLCPTGMTSLCDAPAEEVTVYQKRRIEYEDQQRRNKERGIAVTAEEAISGFEKVAESNKSQHNRWDAVVLDDGAVDEEEWSD